jgi:DNA uptake protein ComE-like DNA-binding protein
LRIELIKPEGIGVVLVSRIIENRPYASWDNLQRRVKIIGEKSLPNFNAGLN